MEHDDSDSDDSSPPPYEVSKDPVYCQLINDLENPAQQLSIISMEIKASGKSTRALAFVRLCLERNYYDEYFLFLPAYSKDIHGSYRWLQMYKDKVVIFTEYRPEFAEMLLDRTAAEVAKNEKGFADFHG